MTVHKKMMSMNYITVNPFQCFVDIVDFTKTLQRLYKDFTKTLQRLYKDFTKTLQRLYKDFTKTLQRLYKDDSYQHHKGATIW